VGQVFGELYRSMKALALVFNCFLDTAEAEAWARSKLPKPVRESSCPGPLAAFVGLRARLRQG
jgi:hypothetical protein